MIYITFENAAGDSVNFFASNYKLVDYSGFEAEIQLSGEDIPFADGQSLDTERLPQRALALNMNILGNGALQIRETWLRPLKKMHAKNTLGYGKLICTIGSKTYFINVKPEAVKESNELGTGNQYLPVQCFYRAFDPYFYDYVPTTLSLTPTAGGLEVPLAIPMPIGRYGDTRSVVNDGDSDMPFILTITGYVETPILIDNTHGFLMQYDGIINTGETLTITTQIGNKTCVLTDIDGNKTNVIDKLSDDSDLFVLEQGTTSLTYVTLFEKGSPTATLTYRRMYNGI